MYFDVFLSVDASAVPPGVPDVTGRYDGARVSVRVTSHVTHLSFCHGMSGRLGVSHQTDLSRPDWNDGF